MNIYESPIYQTPILLKGYNSKHNAEMDYKRAKTPISASAGFTKPDYKPPTEEKITAWIASDGWVGHLVPEGKHVLDVEEPHKIALIRDLCRLKGLRPPINKTNNGVQFVFSTNGGPPIPGADGRITRMGFPVTDRSAKKNYVILPPTNGRSWENEDQLGTPPVIPDELLPAENTSTDTTRALAWELGAAHRKGTLVGYEDLDEGFMALLVLCDSTDEQILEAFRLVFLDDFNEDRTLAMLKRTKERTDKGEALHGTGSLVKSLKDKNLKTIVALVMKLQNLAGVFNKTNSETVPCEDWPEPIPFNDYSHLPEFPIEALPGVCGSMVQALADSCQVDMGLPGSMMLATLSAAIGARGKIILESHVEQGNLYLLSVIGSGNRKSEVNSQLTAPLYIYQKERQEAMIPIIREAKNREKILEKRLEKLEREAAGEEDHFKRESRINDCSALRKKIEENPVPREPKYLVDNITLEELGSVMAYNDERVAIQSAEGGFFKIAAGLYSKGHSNIDLILKAHTGEPWASDRVGRESQSMEHPALTLGLAVQPDVLEEIGRNSEFRGRGLSARFLYSWCRSRAGYRTLQTSPVSTIVKNAYHLLIISLMKIEGRHELTLTPEAQAIWSEFYADVELLLRPGADLQHLVDWGSKLPGAVARISGLLHFAEHGPKGIGKAISAESVKYACVIGSYYCEHAKASFDIMKEDIRLIAARKILDYIKRQKPEKFKGRDIMRHTALKTMEEVKPALIIMVERGYIAPVNKSQAGVGRPEADSYSVNPKIIKND